MWSNVIIEGDSPQERCKHAVVLANHDLYLYGGKSGPSYLKDFWRLELRAARWSRMKGKNSPPPLQEHSMVYHKDQIYIFGGELGIDDQTPLWIYHLKKMEWRKWRGDSKVKSPSGCRGHIALVHSGYMLIHGGYRDLKGSLGDIWAFHFETESWHIFYAHQPPSWYTSIPAARHAHSGIMHGGSLFIYGGMSDLEEKGDFWKFDLGSKGWCQLKCKPNPGPLVAPSMTKAFGSMFIYGGDRNGKPTDELWRFSIESESWERITFHGVKPIPRMFPAVCMLPAIVRVSNNPGKRGRRNGQGGEEDGSYWWDYSDDTTTALLPEKQSTNQVNCLIKRMSGNYQILGSSGVDECGVEENWARREDDLNDLPNHNNPKRSETTNCFRTASTSGYQRVQKSNSVRFSDFQSLSNSTSDYASMETLEELRRSGFENPNYHGPPESIEMETMSGSGLLVNSPGPEPQIEVTTPNYLLVIGGQGTANGHIHKDPILIWRLRVGKELLT